MLFRAGDGVIGADKGTIRQLGWDRIFSSTSSFD